jgi:uncharacterized OB-fold protein
MSDYTNEGHDEWLDALEDGDGYYLRCANDHGSLPPRRVCPHCGDDALVQAPLPDAGEVETYTVTQIASPSFADDTPYATAIVAFEHVKLTGQIRESELDAVEIGMIVEADVGHTKTNGDRVVVFRPR